MWWRTSGASYSGVSISFCLPTRSRRTPSPATRFRWNTSGSFIFVRGQKVESRFCQNWWRSTSIHLNLRRCVPTSPARSRRECQRDWASQRFTSPRCPGKQNRRAGSSVRWASASGSWTRVTSLTHWAHREENGWNFSRCTSCGSELSSFTLMVGGSRSRPALFSWRRQRLKWWKTWWTYIDYLLSSRLGCHSCENLISQGRAEGNIHPGPVRLWQMLWLLSVAQFMAVPSSATYPQDEERYYVDFLVAKKENPI